MDPHDLKAFFEQLKLDGLLTGDEYQYEALTGGVSSEIYRVTSGGRVFVVKRALEQLKVAADWEADLSRNLYEVRYLKYVSAIEPSAVPKVLHEGDGYFAMEYLGGEFKTWKADLLNGILDAVVAERLGAIVGRIHARSHSQSAVRDQFQSLDNFKQLRISPYIDHLKDKHPQIAENLKRASLCLASCSNCLVHGDLSPKNILVGPERIVLLDCEVAWFGDPAFDLAFLVNHLCLKALYHAPHYVETRPLIERFLTSYFQERVLSESSREALESRTAFLLALLLLARADGKSPVEYLEDSKFDVIRAFSVPRIAESAGDLNSLLDDWFDKVESLCQQ